ncbi:MAG: hypothetical protein QNJ46_07200 [Leptolyngbyaceae cyanobacterium MO_188.B28]|nr:hypothetical protein [Leptolyngbyaceae cyanobacterium MO_188.B28]
MVLAILARRRAHFYSSIVLACLLPIVFFIGVCFQPQVSTVGEPTAALFASSGAASASAEVTGNAIASKQLKAPDVQLQASTFDNNGQLWLTLQPAGSIKLPDPLIYWQKGEQTPETLAEDAVLLGGLSGTSRRAYPLPQQVKGQAGHLILYTPIGQKVKSTFPFPAKMTGG